MNLARLVTEVRRRAGLHEHEATMMRFAADRYAQALGAKNTTRCGPSRYLRTPEERAALIEVECRDLPERSRRQILTILDRLFTRAATENLVAGVDRVAAPSASRPRSELSLAFPFVEPDGSLPDGATLEDVEAAMVGFVCQAALRSSSSKAEAARKLGLKKTAFQHRLVKYGLYR